jgi:hypothetical protein
MSPMGLSCLARLLASTQAGVEAQLQPDTLSAMLAAGERLGHADVCDLLSDAVVNGPVA